MSRYARQLQAAQRSYDNMSPDEPPEFDKSPYTDRLLRSNCFCVEAIGDGAQEIADCYAAGGDLRVVIAKLLQREAERTIDIALDRSVGDHHGSCDDMVRMYTRHDARAAA